MKKQITIFIAIAIVVGIVGAAVIYSAKKSNNFASQQTKEAAVNKSSDSNIPLDPITEMYANSPAIKDSVAKIESAIQDEPVYRGCIAQAIKSCGSEVVASFSRTNDDDSVCKLLKDADLAQSCVDAINNSLAQRKMDSTYCQKISNAMRDNCEKQIITSKAIQAKDISLCGSLKGKTVSEKQENVENKSTSTPEETTPMFDPVEDQVSQCQLQVIMSLEPNDKNKELCKEIKSEYVQRDCDASMKDRATIHPEDSSVVPAPYTH